MRSFSQRKGIKPIKRKTQSDSMDDDLRTGLWNVFEQIYRKEADLDVPLPPLTTGISSSIYLSFRILWTDHLKLPLDESDGKLGIMHNKIKEHFFQCEWYEVYDFLEFFAENYSDPSVSQQFMANCNAVLEKELSAYRFVGGKIVGIISEEEISEIEEALQVHVPPVQEHLDRSLALLSDKRNPDYRNSIKESISALESLCIIITEDKKATLGQALKKIEDIAGISLHPAVKKAFSNLYGYTSNADGIRHGLMGEPNLDSEDAKFMLVACSAFINYLMVKVSKAGVNLSNKI